jgi:SAM-dependent methyltransferase
MESAVLTDPTSSHRLFQHDRVAEGYVSARPYLHPQVFSLVRNLVNPPTPFRRALDVGCGTGMSSVALLDLAEEVVGLDASTEMLRLARPANRVRYLASSAEGLPFARGTFDLVVACGSIDWVDRTKFMPEVAELLKEDGWLIPLDFGDSARCASVPGLRDWYSDVFLRRFPCPPSTDPFIGRDEAETYGFSDPVTHPFTFPWAFTADQYAAFLLTESSVIASVEFGRENAEEVRGWLISELSHMFVGQTLAIEFGGYIQLLRRHAVGTGK